MKLSIIIVTYNSWPEIQSCLDSIFRFHASEKAGYEVIVVDNASTDETVEQIKEFFPPAFLIANKKNVGFAAANNIGVKKSTGDWLLFLNPDIIVNKDSLPALIQAGQAKPQAGIISGLLVNDKGHVQNRYIRNFPTPLKTFLFDTKLKYITNFIPLLRRWHFPKVNQNADKQEVDQPAGACMLIKRTAFEQVGGFDEQFFLFFEDVDLAYRLRQAGYKNYILPQVKLKHLGGSSIKKAPPKKMRRYFLESAKKYFRKHK